MNWNLGNSTYIISKERNEAVNILSWTEIKAKCALNLCISCGQSKNVHHSDCMLLSSEEKGILFSDFVYPITLYNFESNAKKKSW